MPFQMVPIVQPGTSQVMVIQPKSEGFDQPQHGPHRDAGAADIARVLGDLGMDQDDMHEPFPGIGRRDDGIVIPRRRP